MPAANPLDIHNDFGRTEVPDFKGPVNLTSKYGSLTAGNLANVGTIDVEFGKASIGDITTAKSSFNTTTIPGSARSAATSRSTANSPTASRSTSANGVTELSVSESYSGIRMVVDKRPFRPDHVSTPTSANFTTKANSPSRRNMKGTMTGPHFDRDYSGTLGDGKAQIKVKSEFGSLRLIDRRRRQRR